MQNKQSTGVRFKPLTEESIKNIRERIVNEKTRLEVERTDADFDLNHFIHNHHHHKLHAQKSTKPSSVVYKFKKQNQLKTNKTPDREFETGKKLSLKYKHSFPSELLGRPIEELDDYYKTDYVFVVVNKNYHIYRFSAGKALYLLSPFNQFRRTAVFLLTHPFFSTFVMLTILANCVIMALPPNSAPEFTEYIFTFIYSIEALLKIIARGFIVDKFSFLRDPWNWLDFVVLTLAYTTIFIRSLGNLSVLRTLRVLRALKTVAIVPGLKTIVDSLIQSVVRLRDVLILTSFVLSVFSLVGLQLYMGVLKRKCVWNGHSHMNASEYNDYVSNSTNWVIRLDENGPQYVLCGNGSGSMNCPFNSTCLSNIGSNPNSGYTNFDSYAYAMLSSFRLMTQDYWENLYNLILTAEGPFQVIYFIAVIFFGSFYLVNLILAIVALSYNEQQLKAIEEAAVEEERKREEIREFSNDILGGELRPGVDYNLSISLNSLIQYYELSAKVNGVCSHRAANNPIGRTKTTETTTNCSFILSEADKQSERSEHSQSSITWHYNKDKPGASSRNDATSNANNAPTRSKIMYVDVDGSSSSFVEQAYNLSKKHQQQQQMNAEEKTAGKVNNDQIDEEKEPQFELDESIINTNIKNTMSDQALIGREDHIIMFEPKKPLKYRIRKLFIKFCCLWECVPYYATLQKLVGKFILDAFVDLFVMVCIVLNTLFLALDQHNMDQRLSEILATGNYIFTAIFTAEALLKLIALSPLKYFENKWNIFDIVIVSISLAELTLASKKMSVLRTFRLLRVFKLAKSWPTLNQLMVIIGETLGALGNLTFVLVIIIFIFAVMGNQLFGPKYVENKYLWGDDLPRWSFVDFFHSFLIVFRVLCGEWIESMWDCLNVAGWPCIPFFLFTMIVGNLVVLNLFLALLLSSFGGDKLKVDERDEELNKIQEACDRIKGYFRGVLIKLARKLKFNRCANANGNANSTLKNNKRTDNHSIELNEYTSSERTETNRESIVILDRAKILTIRRRNAVDLEPRTSRWYEFRKNAFKCVEHKYFEMFIIFMIVLSSVSLAVEDKNIHTRPWLKLFLEISDKFFTIIFAVEIVLKLLAYGFHKYFTDGWCWLDFIIVFIAFLGIFASFIGLADIPAFRAIRTLRALRPLRALSRFDGIRVVVNALIGAIPSILNVVLVCLVFWLIFSIMGVQLFAGRFYKCVDRNNSKLAYEIAPNMQECLSKNYTWTNSRINFDNVINAYLALLQIATFKGWIDIMADAADISSELNEQPRKEQSLYMLLYFVFFIIFGSFFTLNLFIGVIIDNFNHQKKKLGGGSIELFMTEQQKKYYNAMKKVGTKKPQKALPRPKLAFARFFFDITSNQKFDISIMVCIFLNMIVMCMESYNQSERTTNVLTFINNIFIAIFTAESIMKLIALNWRFFKIPWNVFDLAIVALSILSMIFEKFMNHMLTFSPTILRVVRVVKVGRVLRLVKGARGIRTLLFALAISMPALVNIGLLLFLVIFIYAIFGMNFFMYVKYDAGINELFNFETIYRSMITLFPLCTSAGWNGVLKALTNEYPNCDPNKPTLSTISKGDCGNNFVGIIFLVSYLIISFLVVVNMYIAVILENFSQAREEVQQGLTDDDYDMYYEVWQKYDPGGTEFISYDKLFEFVENLEEPLGIAAPNRLKLISMDLTICEPDLIHCVDILDSLTKNYLGTENIMPDQAVSLESIMNDRPASYKPVTSTLKLARQNYAAKIITRAIRKYVALKRELSSRPKIFERATIDEINSIVID